MTLVSRTTNAIAQRLEIIHFAIKMGYPAVPNYNSSPEFIHDESNEATNWLNNYKAEGLNYYGWEGTNWGYYTVL
jgi:hypothetical protein